MLLTRASSFIDVVNLPRIIVLRCQIMWIHNKIYIVKVEIG